MNNYEMDFITPIEHSIYAHMIKIGGYVFKFGCR